MNPETIFIGLLAAFSAAILIAIGILVAGYQPPSWLGVIAFFGFVGAIVSLGSIRR